VVDVAVGSILAYIPIMLKLDISAYPAILNYIKRCLSDQLFKNQLGDVVDKKGLGARDQRLGKKELQIAVGVQ
jgi:hypothetical protein